MVAWTVGSAGLLLLVLAVVMTLVPCQGMYEEQVGHWDWHQQYLGRVTRAAFQSKATAVRRVFVATEDNAIASLNLRTGDIFWRRLLADDDRIHALDYTSRKYIISVSGGSTVRAWNEADGILVWESLVPRSDSPQSLLILNVDINNDRVNDMLVASGNVLTALSTLDGSTLWKSDLSSFSDGFNIRQLRVSTDRKQVYAAGFLGTSGVGAVAVDVSTGGIVQEKRFHFSGILSTDTLVLSNEILVAINSEGSTILTGDLLGESGKLVESLVGSLFASTSSYAVLLPLRMEGGFALGIKGKTVLLKLSSDRQFDIVETVKQPGSVSSSLALTGTKHAVAMFQSVGFNGTHQQFEFRVVDSNEWTDEQSSNSVALQDHKGAIDKCFLNSYTRVDRSYGFRALVVGEDSSLSLVQQGEVVWTREDGLGSIIGASTADLPPEKEGVSVSKVEHGLVEWLKGHLLKLKATLLLATPEEKEALQSLLLNNADKTKMTKDHNGFRKLLIVLTKAGKLVALHSGDGHIVWSLLIPAFRKKDDGSHPTAVKLLPWQIPHQHALDENPVFLVVGRLGTSGVLSWVDARTGKEVEAKRLSFAAKQVIPLPITDASEQRLHMLIDGQQRGHLFPATDASWELFSPHLHNTYHYVVDEGKGTITGYALKAKLEDGEGQQVVESEMLWSLTFPPDKEQIATVVSRRLDEVVHTHAKVLGNRDMWYKYLNRNTIFVATVAPHDPGSLGAGSPEENWLVAYLIDTITGRILHRVTHQHLIGPVHAVFSENWVVFGAFNLRTSRYEMTVLEIYEKSRLSDKGLVPLILGQHNATADVSSYSTPSLEVKSQSYFFTHTVKAMAVTSTARGITRKQILVGIVSDQILALDKRDFDPRRSLTPTPSEKEEGIMPLTDAIHINPLSFLTHSHQVQGLRGILTVPAGLESTSLVFTYGLDIFYTRTAPSKTYDSLTEEFSYALLLITIAALLGGIVFTWLWSERKELSDKWK